MSRGKKGKKNVVVFFIILLLLTAGIIYYFLFMHKSGSEVIEKIDKYNYTLESDDSEITSKLFASLKEILDKEDVDYEAYAKYISQLFVIDLYSMNNKINKYDIGGVKYIYPANIDNFKLKVGETLYKYLEDIENRNQELPEVKETEVVEIINTTFKYQENDYEAYEVHLKWKYNKDLKYDNEGKIIVIKENDMLYVAKYTPQVKK